jgi:hypothetical protein
MRGSRTWRAETDDLAGSYVRVATVNRAVGFSLPFESQDLEVRPGREAKERGQITIDIDHNGVVCVTYGHCAPVVRYDCFARV